MAHGKAYNPFMDLEKLANDLNVLFCKSGYTSQQARASVYTQNGKRRIYFNGKQADGFIEQDACAQWEINVKHLAIYRIVKDHLSIPSGRIS